MRKEDAEYAEQAEIRGEVSKKDSDNLIHGGITGSILGAFYAVHSQLGFGFLETVYSNALIVLLRAAGLDVRQEVPFEITFHGHSIGVYRADLVVESKVIVEIKAGRSIIPAHNAQLLNYLRASNLEVGLLLNFGETASFKRVVLSRNTPRNSVGSA
jgi:GxxExxY protein